jgi:hypothetical protein
MRIISRSEWGARPPKHAPVTIALPTPELWLHHAAGAVIPGDDIVSPADLERVDGIQDYHMDTKGWNDIAYSYLLDPDGNIFEGRGFGVRGAHTANHNRTGHGICVIGNYDLQAVDSDLVPKLAAFVKHGHEQGWWPAGFTGGHRDVGDTSCPGRNLYPKLADINAAAQAGTLILGRSVATVQQALVWARNRGAHQRFIDLIPVAFEVAAAVGVRADVLVALMAKETRFGHFPNVVTVDHHNWGGIKTTRGGDDDDPNVHARFPNDRIGTLAVAQHLYIYAKEPVPDPVDPRHFARIAGTSPTVEGLSGKWAGVDGGDYGTSIVARVDLMIATETPFGNVSPWAQKAWAWADTHNIITASSKPDDIPTLERTIVFLHRAVAE